MGGASASQGAIRVLSVNAGRSRNWRWNGRNVPTAFLKEPLVGRVAVTPLGLAPDEVADTTNHGGPEKALYAYPSEHYDFWSRTLDLPTLPWGSFGENLTLAGVTEGDLVPGDLLEGPDATLRVIGPRTPCFKLNVRFQRDDVLERFVRAGRPGVYLGVVRTGTVAAGDRLRVERRRPGSPSVRAIYEGRAGPEPGSSG